jgi:OOP family OmpA-OmpF porin
MKSKNLFKVIFPFIVFALFMGCATQKAATPIITAVDLNPKLTSNQLAQKTNAFEVIFDATLTMNDAYKSGSKLSQEKFLITLMNDTIPNLKLTAAARAFGQFSAFGGPTSKSLFGPTDYTKSSLPQAIAPFTSGRGLSPLDAALDGATSDLQSQSGQLAVIAFSDGEDMATFAPVPAAQRMKSAYGDRVCIYTVHLGDHPDGKKLMQQVADAGQCGFMVTGDSISTPEGMADFVEKVFLKTYVAERRQEVVKEEPKPVIKEEPKPVVKEELVEVKAQAQAQEAPKVVVAEPVTIELNVQFATGKSNIQTKYHNEIKKVADYMTKYPDTKAAIEGHTDNVGKEAANVKLSQNRANSVKNYLVSKFKIDSSRIEATGYGPKKPIASNSTKEGRQKNRRVTAVFSSKTK